MCTTSVVVDMGKIKETCEGYLESFKSGLLLYLEH